MQQLGTLCSSLCMPCGGRDWSLSLVWTWHELIARHVLSLVSWRRCIYKRHERRSLTSSLPFYMIFSKTLDWWPHDLLACTKNITSKMMCHLSKTYHDTVMFHCLRESKRCNYRVMAACPRPVYILSCCGDRLEYWICFLEMHLNNTHGFGEWRKRR